MVDIVEQVLNGEVRAAARLIRDIDDRVETFQENLKRLFPTPEGPMSSASPVRQEWGRVRLRINW